MPIALSSLPIFSLTVLMIEIVEPFIFAFLSVRLMRGSDCRRVLFVMVIGGLLIAVTDIAHYARDLTTAGALPAEPTHR
jgi:hypothetical protein